jgi:sRNA-binding protein
MRKAVDAANKHSTYELIERLQAENQILKHQVTGYETFFKYKERRKKRGKPLFELQDGETAGWYSPQKVKTAQEQLQQLEEEEKQQQQLKNEQKLRKQQEKAAKQQQVAARKQERELARAEKAAKVAQKKAQKEEEDIQKQAIKQLQNGMKSIKQKQRNKGKKAAQLDSAVEPNSGVGCDDEVVLGISRSGRMRKQPQHLQDYIL